MSSRYEYEYEYCIRYFSFIVSLYVSNLLNVTISIQYPPPPDRPARQILRQISHGEKPYVPCSPICTMCDTIPTGLSSNNP